MTTTTIDPETYPFTFGTHSTDPDLHQVYLRGGVLLGYCWPAPGEDGPAWRGVRGQHPGIYRHYTAFGRTQQDCAAMMLAGLLS